MKKTLLTAAALLIFAASFKLSAQNVFNKNGISFSYPAGVIIKDSLNSKNEYEIKCDFEQSIAWLEISYENSKEFESFTDEEIYSVCKQMMTENVVKNIQSIFPNVKAGKPKSTSLAGLKGLYLKMTGNYAGIGIRFDVYSLYGGTKFLLLFGGGDTEDFHLINDIIKSIRVE